MGENQFTRIILNNIKWKLFCEVHVLTQGWNVSLQSCQLKFLLTDALVGNPADATWH